MKRESWSSHWLFILAAAGSAVGLGNIWKFPYIAGENGGGAFVVVYLLCVIAISFPIMLAEVLLGRLGQSSPIHTMASLRKKYKNSSFWSLIGWMGVICGFIILSYYAVISGWIMHYVYLMVSGSFHQASGEVAKETFIQMTQTPSLMIFWLTLFIGINVLIIARGIYKGLELFIKWSMPLLFILLLTLLAYSVFSGEIGKGFSFLFSFQWEDLSSAGVLAAMGQAFFSLSLGMGAIMVYGSYLSKESSIFKTVSLVVALDTLVALITGLIIFPIVFATSGLQPDAGVGLLFKTLPVAFGGLPAGSFFGTVFFLLVFFAALTSAISILEPALSYLTEQYRIKRAYAAIGCGVFCWILGLGTVFSFNIWSDFHIISSMTIFDSLDSLAEKVLLPLGGLMIAIYVAYKIPIHTVQKTLGLKNKSSLYLIRIFIGFIAPLGIVIVFLHSLNLLPKIF